MEQTSYELLAHQSVNRISVIFPYTTCPSICKLELNYYRPSIIQQGCWSTSCSVNRAYQFYAKTVYPGNEYLFNATKCESAGLFRMGNCNNVTSQIPLGISTPTWARGNFYLTLTSPDLHVPHKQHCNDL